MYNAIILGDIHLGKGVNIGKSGIGSNLNSRIVDQLNLLDWTLEQAVETVSDNIILTGDIFEEPKPHPYLITLFIGWLKKCQAHNVNVHIIIGNHDILRSGLVYSSPLDIISEVDMDNITVYKDINTIFIGTTAFTLVPFRDRKSFNVTSNAEALTLIKESLIYELSSIPVTYKKVVVGHLALEGSIPIGDEIDDMMNEIFCPLDIFEGYDYVWMGHVHKPQIMKKKPHIAHVGSMDISNFGETDHKKHIIVFDCFHNHNFLTKELPTRSLKKITISIPKDTKDTTAYVLDQLNKMDDYDKSIIKVEIALEVPELKSVNRAEVEKYLTEHGAFNVTSVSEAKKINLIKKSSNNTIDTKMDVPSAIKTYSTAYVESKLQSKFIELSLSIFNEFKAESKE